MGESTSDPEVITTARQRGWVIVTHNVKHYRDEAWSSLNRLQPYRRTWGLIALSEDEVHWSELFTSAMDAIELEVAAVRTRIAAW